jgi:hypothetical protein
VITGFLAVRESDPKKETIFPKRFTLVLHRTGYLPPFKRLVCNFTAN